MPARMIRGRPVELSDKRRSDRTPLRISVFSVVPHSGTGIWSCIYGCIVWAAPAEGSASAGGRRSPHEGEGLEICQSEYEYDYS